MEIREAPVEAVWLMRQAVMYPNESLEFVKLEDDARGLHLGLYLEDGLATVISLFEHGDEIQFRKFATRIVDQNKGYGTFLLQYVTDWAVKNGKKKIWCNARATATGLYKKAGMKETGQAWQKYGLDFIKMEKQLY